MSCQTRTCASQSGPAPMPMVGMDSVSVTRAASGVRHALEHDRERARRLQRLGVLQQLLAIFAAALHPVAAEGVHRLRGQAQVRHDRYAGRDQVLDLPGDPAAALQLDGVRAGLLEEPGRRRQRVPGTSLVGAERQVGHDHGPAGAADHGGGQRDQVVHA